VSGIPAAILLRILASIGVTHRGFGAALKDTAAI
jgi:hypothetical protein